MEKEKIYLTEEELEDFDFTGGSKWELRNETYNFIDEVRTDKYSDGSSWDIVVKRESDGKNPRMLDEWQNENKLGQKKVDDIIHCSKIEAMIILRLLKKRETEITEFTMEYHVEHLIENYERILFN